MASDTPKNMREELGEAYDEMVRSPSSDEAFDDDLSSLGIIEKTDAPPGPIASGPVDESIFNDVMGENAVLNVGEIEDILADIMDEPAVVPAADIDLDAFAAPVLLCIGGREIEARLAQPFCPSITRIMLHPAQSCPQTVYDFHQLNYIRLIDKPEQLAQSDKTVTEVVKTFCGRSVTVEVPVHQDFENGVFCLSCEKDQRFQYLFFPHSNIKLRYLTKPIGEILLESRLISRPVLEEILIQQKKMRSIKFGKILEKRAKLKPGTVDRVLQEAWKKIPSEMEGKILTGQILIKAGVATEKLVEETVRLQKSFRNRKVGDLLVKHGHIREDDLYSVLAEKFRKPFINLDNAFFCKEAGAKLPRQLVLKLMVVPLSMVEGRLLIATSRPELTQIIDLLKKHLTCPFDLAVAPYSQLKSVIIRKYGN
jgi:hypothetical protein